MAWHLHPAVKWKDNSKVQKKGCTSCNGSKTRINRRDHREPKPGSLISLTLCEEWYSGSFSCAKRDELSTWTWLTKIRVYDMPKSGVSEGSCSQSGTGLIISVSYKRWPKLLRWPHSYWNRFLCLSWRTSNHQSWHIDILCSAMCWLVSLIVALHHDTTPGGSVDNMLGYL